MLLNNGSFIINRSCGWPARSEAWSACHWILRRLLASNGKTLKKVLVHFFGSLRIPVHFFGSIRIPVHFLDQSESRFIFSVHSESGFIFSVHSESRFIFSVHSESRFFFWFIQNPTSISTYLATWPKYSYASPTFAFLRIYSTKIFLCIPDTSISMNLLNQNILVHLWFLYFYVQVPAQPKYFCAPSIPPILLIYLTIIFLLTLTSSISMYLLDHIFLLTLNSSISTYLLNHDILLHHHHIHFYVPKYSFASLTPQFLLIYSSDQNFLSHHHQLHFYLSTWPESSFASSTCLFLIIYSTKIFFLIITTFISTYLLSQNILAHPRHDHFYLSTWPKHSFTSSPPPLTWSYPYPERLRDSAKFA